MASGADTHTHTHTHTHTYIRTEVILRNQARAWFKNTLGVKKVRGQSEASHNGYISDQKL